MTGDHEEYADWDGAFVLGALSPEDRRRFEAHMEDCERCRASVAELAGLSGLLGRVGPYAEVTDPAPDHALFEKAVRRVEDHRSRRRKVWTLAAAVAAVLLVAALVFVPRAVTADAPDATIALDPMVTTSMTAGLELREVAWGTKIRISCDYPDAGGRTTSDGPPAYVLEITDREGRTSEAASWNAVLGRTVTIDAATAVPLDDIVTIAIRTAAGRIILEKDV